MEYVPEYLEYEINMMWYGQPTKPEIEEPTPEELHAAVRVLD